MKKYKIRKSVLNMPFDSWKKLNNKFTTPEFEIDVKEFIELLDIVSFGTAIINEEENEFIKVLYEEYNKTV